MSKPTGLSRGRGASDYSKIRPRRAVGNTTGHLVPYNRYDNAGVPRPVVSSTETIKHEFSSPWDDSDLVLVVEDQHLHVHRFILKMASPVFKAMLSSDFKEKNASKIPLPEKRVDDFVVLLKQIYPQFNGSRCITLANVERIYKLADEYQMESVADSCREILKSVKKTKANAMEILLKAQVCQADEARQQCCDILQQLTLDELEKNKLFGPIARHILLPKARQLEKCLKQLLPNVLGLLGWVLCLLRESNQKDASTKDASKKDVSKKEAPLYECSSHSEPCKGYYCPQEFIPRDIVRCKNCKVSLHELCKKLSSLTYYDRFNPKLRVDQNIGELLEEMYAILEG